MRPKPRSGSSNSAAWKYCREIAQMRTTMGSAILRRPCGERKLLHKRLPVPLPRLVSLPLPRLVSLSRHRRKLRLQTKEHLLSRHRSNVRAHHRSNLCLLHNRLPVHNRVHNRLPVHRPNVQANHRRANRWSQRQGLKSTFPRTVGRVPRRHRQAQRAEIRRLAQRQRGQRGGWEEQRHFLTSLRMNFVESRLGEVRKDAWPRSDGTSPRRREVPRNSREVRR